MIEVRVNFTNSINTKNDKYNFDTANYTFNYMLSVATICQITKAKILIHIVYIYNRIN